jgi:hypothetical protein
MRVSAFLWTAAERRLASTTAIAQSVRAITSSHLGGGLSLQKADSRLRFAAMVMSKAATPAAYIKSLPAARRKVISAVRAVIKKRLPKGYAESMNWGMLAYEIPLKVYPDTYKQPLMYLALAAQKNDYALYLTSATQDKANMDRLAAAYKSAGRKLDMGKGCLHFKSLEELPLDVIGDLVASQTVEQRIAASEAARTKKK